MTPASKARLDLVALAVIWLGTLIITIVGVPSALGSLLLAEDGSRLLGADGALLSVPPSPMDVAAYWRYMIYAIPGMSLITLGMLWQCIEPAKMAFSRRPAALAGPVCRPPMIFRLLHPPLCFEIPDDWWSASGAAGFVPTDTCYAWIKPVQWEEVFIVSLAEIAPMLRNVGVIKDANGFRATALDGEPGPGGLPAVLSAIVSGTKLPPVEVLKARGPTVEGFKYTVKNGFHRFYASHALGFTHLPCIIVTDTRGSPMFGEGETSN